MRTGRSLQLIVSTVSLGIWLQVPSAHAADKASLACISAAEGGQTARGAGQLLRARELFAKCASETCPAMLRKDCSSWRDDTEREVPSIVIGARDPDGHDLLDATASVDGVSVQDLRSGSAILLDPGPHTVTASAPRFISADSRVVLRAGEKNRPVLLTLGGGPENGAKLAAATAAEKREPRAPSPHVSVGVFIAGGVAVAGLGTFGYFAARGASDSHTLGTTCAPGCSHSSVDALRTKLLIADVALGVAAVGAVAATWIGITGRTSPGGVALQFGVAPKIGGADAVLTVSF